mgnify:CR=1 FL=1
MGQFESKPESNEAKDKQNLWNKTLDDLDRVADRLGMPIDAGIKETVAAFVVNEFPTYGSCEGHVEERFDKKIKLRPYIAVGLNEPRQRFIGESEIKERIAAGYGISAEKLEENDAAERAYWNYIQEQDVPETPEYLAVRIKNEELQKSLQQILEAFYQNRQANKDTSLTIERIGPAGHFRMTTAKENSKDVREFDMERSRRQLMVEQEEIKAFTHFLKARFFGQMP